MRVISVGGEVADVRERLRAERPDVARQIAPKPRPGTSDDVPTTAVRRVEMAPQISEYMVRIYRERLEETGSKERAVEAVKNSDVFRSVLKRNEIDVVTAAVEASHLLDRIIRS